MGARRELHIGLDYIDEVGRILADYALEGGEMVQLSQSRLFFLVNALEEASGHARAAARRLPDSPYAIQEGCKSTASPIACGAAMSRAR